MLALFFKSLLSSWLLFNYPLLSYVTINPLEVLFVVGSGDPRNYKWVGMIVKMSHHETWKLASKNAHARFVVAIFWLIVRLSWVCESMYGVSSLKSWSLGLFGGTAYLCHMNSCPVWIEPKELSVFLCNERRKPDIDMAFLYDTTILEYWSDAKKGIGKRSFVTRYIMSHYAREASSLVSSLSFVPFFVSSRPSGGKFVDYLALIWGKKVCFVISLGG